MKLSKLHYISVVDVIESQGGLRYSRPEMVKEASPDQSGVAFLVGKSTIELGALQDFSKEGTREWRTSWRVAFDYHLPLFDCHESRLPLRFSCILRLSPSDNARSAFFFQIGREALEP